MRRLHPGSRLVVAVTALAALAGALVALLTAPAHHRALPAGGSRFGPPGATARGGGQSLIDAFAPLLAQGEASAGRTGAAGGVTLARAVGRLFVIGVAGQAPTPGALAAVRAHDWGGVVLGRANFSSFARVAALVRAIDATARAAGHDRPLLIARQGGGDSSAFPGLAPASEPQLGAAGRGDLVDGQAQLAARELRALGVQGTLAPFADLGELGGPAQGHAYDSDPRKVSALVVAAVDGYRRGGLISITGHFPGEGAASQDPDAGAATVGLSLPDLLARDIAPFRAVVATAPMIQMSGALYAAFDGVTPATLSADVVSLLRDRLGYRGVIVSGDIGAAAANSATSIGSAAVAALHAGCDLLYLPETAPAAAARAYDAVLVAIRDRRLDAGAIARSLVRVNEITSAYKVRF